MLADEEDAETARRRNDRAAIINYFFIMFLALLFYYGPLVLGFIGFFYRSFWPDAEPSKLEEAWPYLLGLWGAIFLFRLSSRVSKIEDDLTGVKIATVALLNFFDISPKTAGMKIVEESGWLGLIAETYRSLPFAWLAKYDDTLTAEAYSRRGRPHQFEDVIEARVNEIIRSRFEKLNSKLLAQDEQVAELHEKLADILERLNELSDGGFDNSR